MGNTIKMKNQKNQTLDVLRLLATMMVLMVHVGQRTSVSSETSIGQKGVYLFFIMSGYLAMLSFERINNTGGGAKEYYINRAKRILPPYYFILIVEYVVSIFQYRAQGQSFQQIFEPFHGVCGLQYLRYFLFLQYILPSENFGLWNNRFALWTMSSFAFFYLLVPFIYKHIDSYRKALIVTAVLLLFRTEMIAKALSLFNSIQYKDGLRLA